MKSVNNFVANNRNFTIIKRHAPMLLKPAFAGLIVVLLWSFLQSKSIYFSKDGTEIITISVLPIITVIYGVKAALVLDKVWDEYKKISIAVVEKDQRTFLVYRDEQIPIMIHLLLATLGFLILTLMMLLHYPDLWIGRIAIFDTTFVLVLMAIIAMELDDPKRSIWFKNKIPPEWLLKNINTITPKSF